MKKIKLLALMLALLVALCGCGTQDKTEETPAATEAPAVTEAPTEEPTAEPTEEPTAEPTEEPTAEPTEEPTAEPTEEPTAEPTAEPTEEPTAEPEAKTVEAIADEATAAEAVVTAEIADEATAAEAAETAEATAAEAQEDPVLATAYDGKIIVKRSDVVDAYEETLAYYLSYYTQYGYTMDEYDVDFQESVAQETVQMELSERIAYQHAADTGYVLTEEKEAELRAQTEETLAGVRDTYIQYMSAYGLTGEELEQMVDEQLAASGYTFDALFESAKLADVLNHLYNLGIEGVTVTDEEVKAAFDAKVSAQQESFADLDTFINTYLTGEEEILYTPEGVRLMHCLYIALDENEATPDEATAAEATAAEAAADPATLKGYAKAKAVSGMIKAGASFDEMMLAYNEDSSTEEDMMKGYPVAEGSAMYDAAFQDGAQALAHVGDVSDVIVTSYGYFILEYASDLTAGVVDFEARKETETEEALSSKQSDAYSAYIDEMLAEANLQINDLSSLYHIYEAEAAEVIEAYATAAAETVLTDMPAGDVMATLAAGTFMDVLGRIGVDGEEYAFVSVPATPYKGYVHVSALSEAQADDAQAVDNTALVTAGAQLDKLPTFTIVMNDGSVIYGELYPDVTPESVGNFTALANSGFYDGLTFHRVIPGFMIQGGDPNGDGTGGPGYAIKGEFMNNGVENALSHTRGVLSMARSSAMDSAGSQFFIMHADSDYLDGDYASFGLVLGGIETVDLIASVPTDANDKPRSEQAMRTVYVETYGQEYPFTKLED